MEDVREATKLSKCIEWRGARDADGYGRRMHNGKWRGAHRVSYEEKHGPIPPVSMTLVNSLKTECDHGHPLTSDNIIPLRGGRECRICRRAIWATYRAKRRAARITAAKS